MLDRLVEGCHFRSRRALDDAVKARLIPRNPADGITMPKGERPPLRVLSDAELTTGLRRGEICGLMWSDLDTSTGTLKISRTLHT